MEMKSNKRVECLKKQQKNKQTKNKLCADRKSQSNLIFSLKYFFS